MALLISWFTGQLGEMVKREKRVAMADECSCRFVGWINRQRNVGPGTGPPGNYAPVLSSARKNHGFYRVCRSRMEGNVVVKGTRFGVARVDRNYLGPVQAQRYYIL